MKKAFFVLLLLLLLPALSFAQGEACEAEDSVLVYFFWRHGCPNCHAETEFLQELEAKYGEKLEVRYLLASENQGLFYEMAEQHDAPTQWLPATFIPCCNWYVIGFEQEIGKEIERQIETKLSQECEEDDYVVVPLIGRINLKEVSLPLFTVVIAGLDGLNPCAIWVLMFLLSLLIYAKSRRKILFVGGLFIATSGAIYFLFMAAWLNLFLFLGYTDTIRAVIGIVALVFGAINVKDFFYFKRGISLTIPEKAKPKLFERMRSLVKQEATLSTIAGIILLAAFVNLIELACSLGLPAIYTRILTLQKIPPLQYYLYLALYNLIYIVPLALIVGAFAWTLGGRKLTEKQGRVLKLVAGALMLALGLVMLFAPELLAFA